jgi:sugar lactone lactonase YvrE
VETLLEGGGFFESPRWHDGRWWFSDFFRRVVVSGGEEVAHVEGMPSGLGWLPDGSLLVVSMSDRRVLRLHDGVLELHADLSGLCDWHANDMVVLPDGTAYVGNFGFDLGNEAPRPTGLVHVAADGSAKRVAEGLMFPNGMLLHDGTLLVGETYGARLTAFNVEPDGTLSERRIFAAVPGMAPDGCTLDAEGCVWFADARSNRCVRVARDGEIADVVEVPDGLRCFACMLGGDDARTLAICAASSYDENRPHDAVVLAAHVDTPHAGLP